MVKNFGFRLHLTSKFKIQKKFKMLMRTKTLDKKKCAHLPRSNFLICPIPVVISPIPSHDGGGEGGGLSLWQIVNSSCTQNKCKYMYFSSACLHQKEIPVFLTEISVPKGEKNCYGAGAASFCGAPKAMLTSSIFCQES
jgi:hypothetical protein